MIFKSLIESFLSSVGVQQTFIYLGIIFMALVLVGATLLKLPEVSYKSHKDEGPYDHMTFKDMIRTSRFYYIWFMYLVASMPGLLVIGLAKDIGVDMVGLSAGAAGAAVGIIALFNAGGRLIWGTLSDRFGRDRVAAVCALLGIAGYGVLIVGSGLFAIAVAILLIGTAMSWGAAVLPRFMDNLSPEERGAGFGLVRTTYMMASATGSAVVGAIAAFTSWGIAFSVFLVLLGIVVCALGANRALDLGL